ncbi:MAG: hypothetical protein SGJ11_00935 [Phycisphaerae bacterium]|nr:hypothetical protein [Phycisphaerae bacterium]
MIQLTDIHPLTGFLRDHKAHLERLAATGRPEVLTVNGTARVVVQDAISYQKMLDAFDAMETECIVQQRLASIERGQPGVAAQDVLRDVRRRLGIATR